MNKSIGNYQYPEQPAQPPQPDSAVESALSRQTATINGLFAAVDHLENRLSTVLVPPAPETASDKGCAVDGSVQLAASINAETKRLQRLDDQLISILNRLGL